MAGMTKEEALKEIDERYRFWQKHYAPECEKYGEALGLAIEALEKLQHYEELEAAGRLVVIPIKLKRMLENEYCPEEFGLKGLRKVCNGRKECAKCWEAALKGGGQNG